MSMSLFELAGALVANGPGVLFLSALAASIVLIWDWRWALLSSALLLLSTSSMGATLHSVPPIITAGQWLAVIVVVLLLGLSARFRPSAVRMRANANWLLRALALAFLLGAWWVIDPGVSVPLFSQVETDLLIWIALCGVLILSLTAVPYYMGIGLLLLLAPLQAIAPVLMPGAGLSVFVGIAQILTALACAFLTLARPTPVVNTRRGMMPLDAPYAAGPPATGPRATGPKTAAPKTAEPKTAPHPLTPRRGLPRPSLSAATSTPVSAPPPDAQPEPSPSVEERP